MATTVTIYRLCVDGDMENIFVPVGVGPLLWSRAAGQRRGVEDGGASAAAVESSGRRAAAHLVDGHRASLGVSDTLRHGEYTPVDDDHYDQRQVERADGRVELVADRLTQLAVTLCA